MICNRITIAMLGLLLVPVASYATPDSGAGEKAQYWFGKIVQFPGKWATQRSISDVPLVHHIFNKQGAWYTKWNRVGVSVLLAAAVVRIAISKKVRNGVGSLGAKVKRLICREAKEKTEGREEQLRKKVGDWDKEA